MRRATPRRALVLVSIRADFYGRLASYSRFAELFSRSHLLVGPMSHEELERAIELPAARAGLEVEPTLVQALAADVEDQPGGLPMLSTALLHLWRVRDGRLLRIESYRRSGGVKRAVARLAEDAYGRLSESEQGIARGVLLRLAGGEDGSLVRRRMRLADLAPIAGADEVVRQLTDARLLTVTEGAVEVSHESLFSEWPRYRTWLEEDRAGRRLHAHLMASAREWDAGGSDPSDLYRGARLAGAVDWASQHDDQLSLPERRFLVASRRHAERNSRRLRGLVAVLALLVAASLIAGLVALSQKRHATSEARVALARQLGVQAVSEPQIDLAMLLARESVNLDRSPQTEGSLMATLLRGPAIIGTLALPGKSPFDVALSPDGRTLAVADFLSPSDFGHDIRFYDPRTHAVLRPPLGDLDGAQPPAYSRDGSLLVYPAVDPGGPFVAVRDAHTFAMLAKLQYAPSLDYQREIRGGIQIAPDKRTVYFPYWMLGAAGSPAPAFVARWALPSGRPQATTRIGSGPLLAARLVDGGAVLAVVTASNASLFDSRSLHLLRSAAITPTPASPSVAAVSPDGHAAAIGSQTGAVSFADLATGTLRRAPIGHDGAVGSVMYSADGRHVLTYGDDGKVIVWNPTTAKPVAVLTGPAGHVTGAALSPDGTRLYSTSELGGAVITWDLVGDQRFGRRGPLGVALRCCAPVSPPTPPLTVSPDGSRFAAAIGGSTIAVYSSLSLQRQASFTINPRTVITALASSPTGSELAVAGHSGVLQLWSVHGPPRAGPIARRPALACRSTPIHRSRRLLTRRAAPQRHRLQRDAAIAWERPGTAGAARNLARKHRHDDLITSRPRAW
jgi:WD40 repeat protein